jgi:hypothetical protein
MFDQYIVESLAGRGFFITSSGELCLRPSGAAISSAYLWAAQPQSSSAKRILNTFFVSDVYVDGYMYGKAVDERDAGTRELQTFVLH